MKNFKWSKIIQILGVSLFLAGFSAACAGSTDSDSSAYGAGGTTAILALVSGAALNATTPEQLGAIVENPGDLDEDGVSDVVVETDAGARYVLFLNTDGTIKAYEEAGQ